MSTISGRVLFDRDRTAVISQTFAGIANVSVVLQNIQTEERLAVLTDANGSYSFINVPNGNYRIVESFGTPAVPTPGDFNNAMVGSIPVGVTPPITFVSNPPPGATNLDCTIPNTILVTVSGVNLINENFLNGPVRYTPITVITDACTTISTTNLITAADNGTFGFFPAGTPANTGANPNPYPGLAPDFTYVLPNPNAFVPLDGEYTIQNIMNNAMSNQIGAWWRIADHTTGNETGRMMVVNGFEPGSVFFRTQVTVNPNTNYLFSSWILNLFKALGFPNPELGVQVLDENGNTLYSATLGALIPVNLNTPEWKQIGTVINSQNNTTLTVEFLSEGQAAVGNDYAIDDVSLNEIEVPVFTPVKSASATSVVVGETITYTVTLTNTCESPLTSVLFQDIVPNGFTFVPDSVTINGILQPGFNPNTGFMVPDIPGGGTATIMFSALATSVPPVNPTINVATMTYEYTPVEGGIPAFFEVMSNEVPVQIAAVVAADISVVKTASPSPVSPGGVITYTLTVANAGPFVSENVVLTDNIPSVVLNPEFSTNGGASFSPWTGSLSLGNLAVGAQVIVIIRGTVSVTAMGQIVNTARVTSPTPDPNLANNTSTVTTPITQVVPVPPRCQAITDLIESAALQEAGIAHILNAEGEKIQAAIATENITPNKLLKFNKFAIRLINGITRLEAAIHAKLELFSEECKDEDEEDDEDENEN